jgi:hypothetical protein
MPVSRLIRVLFDLQGATAEVYLHGAHVVSWKDASGKVTAAVAQQQLLRCTPNKSHRLDDQAPQYLIQIKCFARAGLDVHQQKGYFQAT